MEPLIAHLLQCMTKGLCGASKSHTAVRSVSFWWARWRRDQHKSLRLTRTIRHLFTRRRMSRHFEIAPMSLSDAADQGAGHLEHSINETCRKEHRQAAIFA